MVPLLLILTSIPLFALDVKSLIPLNDKAAVLLPSHIGQAQNEMLEEVTLVAELPFNESPFPVALVRVEFAMSRLPPSILMQSLLEFEKELPCDDALPL